MIRSTLPIDRRTSDPVGLHVSDFDDDGLIEVLSGYSQGRMRLLKVDRSYRQPTR